VVTRVSAKRSTASSINSSRTGGQKWVLTDKEVADLEAEVNRGLENIDESFADLGDEIDEQLQKES
jgi:hypothetical protein